MYSKDYSVWLSISLFCQVGNWHILLNEGIKPFLQMPFVQASTDAYDIRLGYHDHGGEHVAFSLLTPLSNAERLAQNTDKFFTQFFQTHLLSTPAPSYYGKTLFMPIPCNSVQFGLYSIINEQEENVHVFQSSALSRIILAALAEESLDDETIVTFALYLYFALIEAIGTCTNSGHSTIQDELTIQLSSLPMEELSEIINDRYLANKPTIDSIAADFFSGQSDDISWLSEWKTICKQMQPRDLMTLGSFINIHLGLNQLHMASVYSFLKNTLNKSGC
jgi:hypothetical protein